MAGLIAHWPLEQDARDAAGDCHGEAREVRFEDGAAVFDGARSVIEIPDAPALRLGNAPFTVTARIQCRTPVRGPFGDVLAKFDPVTRCGLTLAVAGSAPAYCGMGDTRHVHAGIDDGYLGPWVDHGWPMDDNPLVSHLLVFEGDLYASTTDAADPMDACRVMRWRGGTDWEDCGRLGDDPGHLSVMSMCVHAGRLHAGTGVWDWHRASTDPAQRPGFEPALSRIFVHEGGAAWRDLGPVGHGIRVHTMCSFEGHLYAGLDRADGRCFRLEGDAWVDCGCPNGNSIETLTPLGGVLYGATHGIVWRYEGGRTWTCIGEHPHGITQNHSIHVFGGQILVGTWPQGYVLRREDDGAWTSMGRLGIAEGLKEINEINGLLAHNGKLYAGVLPKAQVWRFEHDGCWSLLGSLASRADYAEENFPTWLRVTSLTTHAGRLFACTGACQARTVDIDPDRTVGRVWSAQAGVMASHERDIGGDWTRLAVVREGRALRLYVNGALSAESTTPTGIDLDLANTRPLLIGRGAQNSFDGAIRDVRLHDAALAPDDIAAL